MFWPSHYVDDLLTAKNYLKLLCTAKAFAIIYFEDD